MTVCGEVIQVKKSTVLIRTQRPASCEGCANAGICNKKELKIEAANTLSAKEGDLVKIEMPQDGKALLLLGYIFLIPAAILLLSVWLASVNIFFALAALPALAAYFWGLRKLNKTHKTTNYTAEIITPAGEKQK